MLSNNRLSKFYTSKTIFYFLIFALFFVPRVLFLGLEHWSVDSIKWMRRSDEFIENIFTLDIKETYRTYHPGVTVMILAGTSKAIYYSTEEFVSGISPKISNGIAKQDQLKIAAFIAKLPIMVVISITLTLACWILLKITKSKLYAIIFASTLSLEPFFLGISRQLHLTGLETSFIFLSIISAFYARKSNKRKFLILAGISLGLGILTKISSTVAIPFLLILFTPYNFKNGIIFTLKKYLTTIFILFGSSFLVIFILFPALWFNPLEILRKMLFEGVLDTAFTDEPSNSYFRNPWLFYYEVLFTKTLGLTFVAWIGSIILFFKTKDHTTKKLIALSFAFTLYYLVIMSIPSKQMHRYAVVVYPFVVLGSSAVIYKLLSSTNLMWRKLLVIGGISYYAFSLFMIMPNYTSYYSELIGFTRGYSNFSKPYADYYIESIKHLNNVDKNPDKLLLLESSNQESVSQQILEGKTQSISTVSSVKNIPYYISLDYHKKNELPESCKIIKSFGHRWPDNFSLVNLYKCNE